MRRGKRLLAALLTGMLVCSGGGRYNSAMAFSDDAESFVLSDENAEYEEQATEGQPAEGQISDEAAEDTDTAEIEMEEEISGDEESTEEDVFADCIPDEPEEGTSEEEIEFVAEEPENAENVADAEHADKKCIASFNFDSSEQGLEGAGAKAEVIDSSKSMILSGNGYHGRALYLDGSGESALKVTKEDGSSLLTGVDELTVSYYSRPTEARTNWGFYAAASEDTVTFNQERYLGVYEKIDANGKRTVGAQRYNNSGARPTTATTDISADGWHHIVVVFSSEEDSDTQPEEDTQDIEAESEAVEDAGDISFDTESSEDSQDIEFVSEDTSTYAAEDTQAESQKYKISIYVDGEKKAEVENPHALTDVLGDNSILQIGKANWKNGEYYKGYIDEYSIYNYAMTDDEIRNFTVQPSEAEAFSRTLYFDNVLSRLEGVESDTQDGLDANGTEESSLYYSYDEGKTWYSMSKVDADEGLGRQVSYVSLWKATIPESATAIQFRGWYKGYTRNAMTYTTGYRTSAVQTIPTDVSLNCYYGNPMVYQLDTSGTVLNGHWANVNTINTIGQQSVEIPDGTFTRNKDLYYGNSSFFDYYSDYELNGAKLSQSNATNEDEYNDQPIYAWNLAIDRYYKAENEAQKNVSPLYFGGARMMIGNKDLNGRLTGYDGRIVGGNGFSGAAKTTIGENAYFPNKGLLSTTTLDGAGLKLTNSNLTVPYFDADYLLGDNEEKTQLASVYQNIAFPFEMSDSGYWTFDSSDANYALQMKKDSSSGQYFLEQTKNPVVYGTQNYFFPFNTAGTHGYNAVQKLDYMFGSVIEVPFALTEDRKNEDTNTVFTFSGDDDVWIFLEGPDGVQHLVLDIGGSHGAVSGAIDFTTGLVATSGNWSALGSNSGTATAMGKDDFINMAESGGVQSIIDSYSDYIWSDSLKNMGIDVDQYQSYKEYKIKVYYMERGLDQSNLRITFNFVNNKNVEVKKEWSDGAEAHANDPIVMTLYQVSSKTGKARVTDKADIGVQYAGAALVDSDNESGQVTLNQSNNWSCRWGKLDLKSNAIGSDEIYSYYVAESDSPPGYVIQYYNNTDGTRLETEELTLEDGTKVQAVPASDVSVSIRVENKKVGRLVITKEGADLSDTQTSLSDITFELYQSNDKWKKVGNALATKTTDTNGLVTFDDLFPGNYLLYETVGKDGIYKPEEPWKITVAGDGKVTILDKGGQNLAVLNSQDEDDGYTDNQTTIINYKLLNLELLKIDAEDSNKALAGVTFKLERQIETGRWRTVATGVTDENGYISGNDFQGLQEGNYRLTEIKAAAGYNLLKEPISFTISYGVDDKVDIKLADGTPEDIELEKQSDNFTVKLTVSNTRGTVMPATGGNGTEKFLFGGCLFLIAGLLYGYDLRRRRERRRIR